MLDGAIYIEEPGTDGPPVRVVALRGPLSRSSGSIAAAGYPADEVELDAGVTYDEMRPGCWNRGRSPTWTSNHVEASLCFPNYPASAASSSSGRRTRSSRLVCVEAYNDWMVEEWCGDSGGRLIPLCIVPLWDAELAAEEVRRNAARGVRAVAFSELPGVARPARASTPATGIRSSRRARRPAPCCRMHIGSGTKTTHDDRPTRPDAVQATIIFVNSVDVADRLACSRGVLTASRT